ncbi:hypothetical protein ACFL2Q_09820, partial [Thermodesulfobacteriota bacterium]
NEAYKLFPRRLGMAHDRRGQKSPAPVSGSKGGLLVRSLLSLKMVLILLIVAVAQSYGSGPTTDDSVASLLRNARASIDLGYSIHPRGIMIDFGAKGDGLGGLIGVRHEYPVEGLWLTRNSELTITDSLAIRYSGSWLIPFSGQSSEYYDFGGVNAGSVESRTWTSNLQWWTIDGAALLSACGPATFLAGLRYDSLQSGFKNPGPFDGFLAGLGRTSFRADEADLDLYTWIPYGGAEMGLGPVTVGVLAAPTVFGNIKYGETFGYINRRMKHTGSLDRGYFFEGFARFSTEVGWGSAALVGAFAKYSYLHGTGTVDATTMDFAGASDFTNDTFDLSVRTQNWVIGATLRVELAGLLW